LESSWRAPRAEQERESFHPIERQGYLVGEQVSIKRPRELFFDDISAARLAQSNFHRFILRKNIGERAWVSADYAFQSGTETWREAFRIRTTELRAIDTFHFEIYEVSHIHPGYGFAAYGEKTVLPPFIVGGGYADIDRPMLNSPRYGRGKRLFLTTKVPINEALSIVLFATQATDHAATNVPQQRFDIALYYNLLYHCERQASSKFEGATQAVARQRRFGVPSRAFWRTR
jgi:hypothetical protein